MIFATKIMHNFELVVRWPQLTFAAIVIGVIHSEMLDTARAVLATHNSVVK